MPLHSFDVSPVTSLAESLQASVSGVDIVTGTAKNIYHGIQSAYRGPGDEEVYVAGDVPITLANSLATATRQVASALTDFVDTAATLLSAINTYYDEVAQWWDGWASGNGDMVERKVDMLEFLDETDHSGTNDYDPRKDLGRMCAHGRTYIQMHQWANQLNSEFLSRYTAYVSAFDEAVTECAATITRLSVWPIWGETTPTGWTGAPMVVTDPPPIYTGDQPLSTSQQQQIAAMMIGVFALAGQNPGSPVTGEAARMLGGLVTHYSQYPGIMDAIITAVGVVSYAGWMASVVQEVSLDSPTSEDAVDEAKMQIISDARVGLASASTLWSATKANEYAQKILDWAPQMPPYVDPEWRPSSSVNPADVIGFLFSNPDNPATQMSETFTMAMADEIDQRERASGSDFPYLFDAGSAAGSTASVLMWINDPGCLFGSGQVLGDPMSHIFGTLSTCPDVAAGWFTQPSNGVDRQNYWFGQRDWPWDGSTGITAAADAAINTHPGDESATELASRFVNQFGGHLDDLRTGITRPRVTIIDVNGNLTDASRLPLSPEAQRNIANTLHDYARWIPPDHDNAQLEGTAVFPSGPVPDPGPRDGYVLSSPDGRWSSKPYFETTSTARLVGESMNDPVAQNIWGNAFYDEAEHTASEPGQTWHNAEKHYQEQTGYAVRANQLVNVAMAAAADAEATKNIQFVTDVISFPITEVVDHIPVVGPFVSEAADHALDAVGGAVAGHVAHSYQDMVDQYASSGIGGNENISDIHDAFEAHFNITPPTDTSQRDQEMAAVRSEYGNGQDAAEHGLPATR